MNHPSLDVLLLTIGVAVPERIVHFVDIQHRPDREVRLAAMEQALSAQVLEMAGQLRAVQQWQWLWVYEKSQHQNGNGDVLNLHADPNLDAYCEVGQSDHPIWPALEEHLGRIEKGLPAGIAGNDGPSS
jgi:hypothetical protein